VIASVPSSQPIGSELRGGRAPLATATGSVAPAAASSASWRSAWARADSRRLVTWLKP
jgi:hypothetical protein